MNTKLNTRQQLIREASGLFGRKDAIKMVEARIRRNAKARNPKFYKDPVFGICGIFHIGKIR